MGFSDDRLATPLFRPSKTKFRVLQLLEERPATSSELGRLLGIDRSAAFRHLGALEKLGLVTSSRTGGRKWVVYALTEKGQDALRLLKGSDSPA